MLAHNSLWHICWARAHTTDVKSVDLLLLMLLSHFPVCRLHFSRRWSHKSWRRLILPPKRKPLIPTVSSATTQLMIHFCRASSAKLCCNWRTTKTTGGQWMTPLSSSVYQSISSISYCTFEVRFRNDKLLNCVHKWKLSRSFNTFTRLPTSWQAFCKSKQQQQ